MATGSQRISDMVSQRSFVETSEGFVMDAQIARLVVMDCILQLGGHRDGFPSAKAHRLIQGISAKITDPTLRKHFIQQLMVKLKAIQ